MASYKVEIKRSALKELERIPLKKARQRIAARIRALGLEPRPTGVEKLTGQNRYRVRQGSYRIVYEIVEDTSSVVLVKIGHRRDVYR